MRKTQLEIVNKAKKYHLADNIIDYLSDESLKINTIRLIYNFYKCRLQDTVENPNIVLDIFNFYEKVAVDLGYNWTDYDLFWNISIQNILLLKQMYENQELNAKDIYLLSCISRNLKNLGIENINEMLQFHLQRKDMIKELNIEEEDYITTFHSLLSILYTKYPKISLLDKINIEKELRKNRVIKNSNHYLTNIEKDAVYKVCMDYVSKDLIGIYDVIREYYANRLDSSLNEYSKNNNFGYHFFGCSDSEMIKQIKEIIKNYPELIEDKDGKITFTAHKNKYPYSIDVASSTSGISITYKEYRTYQVFNGRDQDNADKNIRVMDQIVTLRLLFTYDKHCFVFNDYMKRWIPILLSSIPPLFEYKFLKDIFNSYMDILAEDNYIWKDIKRELNEGCGMPPLKLNEIIIFRTKKDMMMSMYKKAENISLNWNKRTLYDNYIAMKAISIVRKQDRNILTDFMNKHDLRLKYNRKIMSNIHLLIYEILEERFKNHDNTEDDWFFICTDYVNMSKRLHKKISLSFNSPRTLQEAHDELNVNIRDKNMVKVIIPKDTKFKKLRTLLPKEFEWIKTTKRLIQEGTNMCHCVATYSPFINQDICAIYSVVYEEKRYTIEFRYKDGKYIAYQIQGKCDSGCSAEVKKYIESFL